MENLSRYPIPSANGDKLLASNPHHRYKANTMKKLILLCTLLVSVVLAIGHYNKLKAQANPLGDPDALQTLSAPGESVMPAAEVPLAALVILQVNEAPQMLVFIAKDGSHYILSLAQCAAAPTCVSLLRNALSGPLPVDIVEVPTQPLVSYKPL